jgi:hypothetical protein
MLFVFFFVFFFAVALYASTIQKRKNCQPAGSEDTLDRTPFQLRDVSRPAKLSQVKQLLCT